MKYFKAILAFLLAPALVFAQTTAETILEQVKLILDSLVPILITLAVVYFFWGMAKFILNAGDPEKRKASMGIMVWGIIALFVMVSVWGLVAVIQETFGTIDTAKVTGVENFIP